MVVKTRIFVETFSGQRFYVEGTLIENSLPGETVCAGTTIYRVLPKSGIVEANGKQIGNVVPAPQTTSNMPVDEYPHLPIVKKDAEEIENSESEELEISDKKDKVVLNPHTDALVAK